MSKIGLGLVAIYILIIARPIWNVFFSSHGSGFFGPEFGLLIVTLPGSAVAEFLQRLVDPYGRRVEHLVYLISALLNMGLLYLLGIGIGKIYQNFFK